MYGFYRIASATTICKLGDTDYNSNQIIKQIKEANSKQVQIILFSELTITGYSMGDIFYNQTLFKNQNIAISKIIKETKDLNIISIIGAFINYKDRLYNSAIVIQKEQILGVVPKTYLINREEFYEKRYFNSGKKIKNIYLDSSYFFSLSNTEIPFGTDLLFKDNKNLTFGIEICEDLWAISPPSNKMTSSGANLIFNLSASNEIIGKKENRRDLIKVQSFKSICGYVYSSSGVGESTTDTVFGGDAIIYENGELISENKRFSLKDNFITADIDLEKLKWLRLRKSTFNDNKIYNFREIKVSNLTEVKTLNRKINKFPFLPKENLKDETCQEIIDIQSSSIIKRLLYTKIKKVIIGLSGGLDSSLALLSLHYAFKIMNWNLKNIISVTMPSFGTSDKTLKNAIELSKILEVTFKNINITKIVEEKFQAIKHNKKDLSIVYENVQARTRTSILMNMANQENGLVIGTGNLSEIALGWNTYNGDHMSMYAINSGIPKTLIKYLISYFEKDKILKKIILSILETPISPELLPNSQITENIIGPYELHDFFLYHFLKYGATQEKILFLAEKAFNKIYEKDIIYKYLKLFMQRFFTQQFKRNCSPDGVKIGSINLSPRTDWKMPSDINIL